MLEKIDLTRTLSKERHNALKPHLQRRLCDLEKACWDAKIRDGSPTLRRRVRTLRINPYSQITTPKR